MKFVGTANPITNFKFAEEYAKNNKQNKYLIFIFLAYLGTSSVGASPVSDPYRAILRIRFGYG